MAILKKNEIIIVNVSDIKENEENPRYITKDDFADLVESIKGFPQMLEVKPIVLDENYIILGGNMRIKALKEAGFKTVPVAIATGWSDEQKKEFIIKDNIHSGRWDTDILANDWNTDKLASWGLNIFTPEDINLGEFFEEEEERNEPGTLSNTIVLTYSDDECIIIKDKLSKIASTPEEAIRILLSKPKK